jgi:HAMP domain-containing protein
MSLRLRLTLLYSTLMGAILLVISAAVTLVITALLLNQIDETLDAAQQVFSTNRDQSAWQGRIEAEPTDVSSNVYMQIWGLDGDLQSFFGSLNNFETTPFDEAALRVDNPAYRDLTGPAGISACSTFLWCRTATRSLSAGRLQTGCGGCSP